MQENERDFSVIKNRILKYLEVKGFTKASFYKETGAPNGILSQKNGISEENLLRFTSAYPDINLWWLHHGQGEMLLDGMPKSGPETAGQVYSRQMSPVAYPAAEEYFESNVADIVVGRDEWLDCKGPVRPQSVPLYEWKAASGLSSLFRTSDRELSSGMLALPNLPACDGALYVTGDAMQPFLKAGDIVIYKEVQADAACVEWNKMYLLSFAADGGEHTVVRYLHRADDDAHVRLLAPDPHYPIRVMPLRDILALVLVKATVRFNTLG